jgi:hypothetical protein
MTAPVTPTIDASQFIRAAKELQARLRDGLELLRVTDKQAAILSDTCSEIMLTGSNRGGKSLLAAARFASIVRDKPITTMDGKKIHCRRPDQRGKALVCWVIGDYLKHIGQTIHRVLFEERLFEVVTDPETGALRAWNPVTFPSDWDIPPSSRQYAPPLIPPSEIKKINYENAGAKEFTSVELHNGTMIFAFASSGEVKQGDAVDEIWVDEHLVYDHYYSEYAARLQDRDGRLFWSTIHRDDSTAFMLVEDRAALQAREVETGERQPEEVNTRMHTVTIADNPFIPENAKKKFAERVMGERDYQVRVLGQGSRDSIRIYPEYDPNVHVVDYAAAILNDPVTEAMRKNGWRPPRDWTRELILDPGTQKPGILFGAVPPPSMWDHGEPYFVVYDEIFFRRKDAFELAQIVDQRERGFVWNRFIIDGQAARQKPMGFSHTIGRQYSLAFERYKISSQQTQYTFIPGDPDFGQRSRQVKTALRMRPCGRPQLRIVGHACPELILQLRRNVRKTDKLGDALEMPADNQIDDLRNCLEYWLSRHPTYVAPLEQERLALDEGYQAYLAKMRLYADFQKQGPAESSDNSVNIGISA